VVLKKSRLVKQNQIISGELTCAKCKGAATLSCEILMLQNSICALWQSCWEMNSLMNGSQQLQFYIKHTQTQFITICFFYWLTVSFWSYI